MRATSYFRRAGVLALLLTTGCATTVYRLDGEFETPAGPAENPCETKDWLVVAPTRAEVVPEGRKLSITEDEGVGLYHVGSDSAESLTGLKSVLEAHGGKDILDEKTEVLEPYDQKRILSGALGVAGVGALVVGSVLLVKSFETRKLPNNDEEQSINSSKLTVGAIVMAVGLGLGVAGVAINPTHAERTRANAKRYVFASDELPREDVQQIVGGYNQGVRERCAKPQ